MPNNMISETRDSNIQGCVPLGVYHEIYEIS